MNMKTPSLILTALLMTPQGLNAALTRIGAAAAVSGRVLATAPKAAAGRILGSGKTVWHMDKIETDAKGRMQIMLLDQTVFTIGPKTELIFDEFVYDPVTDTGKVSARITRGVFRFVTGKIARKEPSKMKIKLPVGTIGIRGTIAAGVILPDGTEMVALLAPGPNNAAGERPGSIDVTSEGVTRNITSPGFGVLVKKGEGVSKVMKFSKEQLGKLEIAPPGGKSAKVESGEDDDNAQGDLRETESTGQSATDVGIQDGTSPWDQVRSIAAILEIHRQPRRYGRQSAHQTAGGRSQRDQLPPHVPPGLDPASPARQQGPPPKLDPAPPQGGAGRKGRPAAL